MNMERNYFAIAECVIYNAVRNTSETEYLAISCANFVDAMSTVVDYYMDELESCKITLIEIPVLPITMDMAEELIKGNY